MDNSDNGLTELVFMGNAIAYSGIEIRTINLSKVDMTYSIDKFTVFLMQWKMLLVPLYYNVLLPSVLSF